MVYPTGGDNVVRCVLSNLQRTSLDPWQRLAAEIIKSGLYREGASYVPGRCGRFWASTLGLDADYLINMAGGVGPMEALIECGCDNGNFFSDSMTRGIDLEPSEKATNGLITIILSQQQIRKTVVVDHPEVLPLHLLLT